jgi:hypothetical protein
MIDIIAALSLATAAARDNNDPQLFSDAELLYNTYKEKKDVNKLSPNELTAIIEAVNRVSSVAVTLVRDPNQLKNIVSLLSSI